MTDLAAPTPPDTSTAAPTNTRRLVRPADGRRLGGVCAGIADRYGWSRTTVRVLTAVSVLLPGPQVIAYLVLWLAIPDERDGAPIASVDVDKALDDAKRVVTR